MLPLRCLTTLNKLREMMMMVHYKLYSACFVVMMSFSSVSAASLDRGFRFEVGNAALAALPGQPGVLDVAKGRDVSLPITVIACVDVKDSKTIEGDQRSVKR